MFTSSEYTVYITKSCIYNNWIDKAFKGTVVNQALSCLHEGSIEITLTVPLIVDNISLWCDCANIRYSDSQILPKPKV